MNKRAEEFVNSKVSELNGLAPLKSEVIKWLIDFASDEVKAINYNRCCKSDSELLPTKKEIIFDDSLMAEIETTDKNLKVLRAVNGWGVPINIANVQINDK